jgi:hypothetical protein
MVKKDFEKMLVIRLDKYYVISKYSSPEEQESCALKLNDRWKPSEALKESRPVYISYPPKFLVFTIPLTHCPGGNDGSP